jgi:hypothetical protein
MIGLAWQIAPYRDLPERTWDVVLFAYYHTDFLGDRGTGGWRALLEGVGLMAATVTLLPAPGWPSWAAGGPRPVLPPPPVVQVCCCGSASHPEGILARTPGTARVSAHVADVNAAGIS